MGLKLDKYGSQYLVWWEGETEEHAVEIMSALDEEDAVVEACKIYDDN